ncbi:hypothetical protein BGW36DRAFT_422365 [Talaromyces proteolyticus]|uniref:Uncharacterized protein n=1 Tax=Talaromyces proteolyticus TaxID=1131652 RepID=A0AAD4L1H2_9EURO|nr:uncharacterized protein BGW36DRAFT_422365 [Talaromyces proteolyticus]KAH8705827.1 hypothetical protein BGW36DRAFT_422365 [Talaromyces proteolyticus]
MTGPEIWHRKFTRVSGPDTEFLMEDSHQKDVLKDKFGQFLQESSHSSFLTFDQMVSYYYQEPKLFPQPFQLRVSVVADGAHVQRSSLPGKDKIWLNPHCRLLAVADFALVNEQDVIFIIGSDDVHNSQRFLQAASWNGKNFHYYTVEDINDNSKKRAWTFQATSADAFTDQTSYDVSYLGPFNGHVNGPWYHWYTGQDLQGCLSDEQKKILTGLPYLSSFSIFSKAMKAESVEGIVTNLVEKSFDLRAKQDLRALDGVSVQDLTANSHLGSSSLPWRAPTDLFLNFELLSKNKFSGFSTHLQDLSLEYKPEHHYAVVGNLRLSLLQKWSSEKFPSGVPVVELQKGKLGGGKQTDPYDVMNFLEVASNAEGKDIQFVAL